MFKHTLTTLALSVSVFANVSASEAQFIEKPVESVISLPAGHFFENLTFQNKEELVATDYTGMSLYKYHEDGQATLWSKVDGHPVSIRFDEKGEGLLSVHETSILEGKGFLNSMALYKVNKTGELTRLLGIESPAFLNGMAYLGNSKYLIADAINGKIYQFDMKTNQLTTWLDNVILQPEQDRPGLPGVNGIQLYKGSLYFTNSAKQLLGKVNLQDQKAGAIEIIESGIQADDFVIDGDGTWFITTHHHEIIKLTAGKEKSVVLNHGIAGNTAIQMSRKEAGIFYITNDGGLLFGGKDNAGLHKVKF
ncbi:hypothetical protein L3Q72_09165 [Vibrio sp. JC009]|uniref:hypothetical protein n=1 Tax=Vibrio sp. JC009 TaxID=2912314 RepID=UPI0023B19A93|nr:hypothetical protein [Vibrio sp. JC009]WED20813.1 hypothetical protein L3Q72_09165 [Vibrio sp. JC009]